MHYINAQFKRHIQTPLGFYNLTQKIILFLYENVYKINKRSKLYVWSGIITGFASYNSGIQFVYKFYLNTLLNALNDLIIKYKELNEYIEWIDTTHVSDGFRTTIMLIK